MEERLDGRTLYRGKILNLRVDRVEIPGRGEHVREVVEHAAAAAVIPILPNGHVLLIRQYRYAVGQVLWEIPAGLIESGETPRQAAGRELLEETGYASDQWAAWGWFYSSPGFSLEKVHLFLALNAVRRFCPRPDKGESVRAVVRSPLQIQRLLARGGFKDGKTRLALLLAEKRLHWSTQGRRCHAD